MSNNFKRNIFYYKNYYLDFFNKLSPEVQDKINWTLQLIATLDRIPEKYFKHIESTDDLFEIRVEYNSNIYRIISFFDKGNLVILLNAFQ